MIPRALSLAPLLALAAGACAPPAEPPAQPVQPAPTAAAAPAPAAPEEPPSARVIGVEPGKESIPDARAKIVFANPTKRACRFLGYKVTWPGGNKSIKLDGLTVPPGETRERSLKVHPADGDVAKLDAKSARVDVEVDCKVP